MKPIKPTIFSTPPEFVPQEIKCFYLTDNEAMEIIYSYQMMLNFHKIFMFRDTRSEIFMFEDPAKLISIQKIFYTNIKTGKVNTFFAITPIEKRKRKFGPFTDGIILN